MVMMPNRAGVSSTGGTAVASMMALVQQGVRAVMTTAAAATRLAALAVGHDAPVSVGVAHNLLYCAHLPAVPLGQPVTEIITTSIEAVTR